MKHIAIITKRSDPRAITATHTLAEWLHSRQLLVSISDSIAQGMEFSPAIHRRALQDEVVAGADLVVVIGGDGTFLAAARAVGRRSIPLLGINMGRLGFLTELTLPAMLPALEEILAGNYSIEERTTLRCQVECGKSTGEPHQFQVLNDVVLHKGELARMIEFEVAVDGQFVFSSRADGLIVATPTGSTAYALSAGGPIIHPSMDAVLLVPICPHTLTNRPIALPGGVTITITLAMDGHDRLLTMDGQLGLPLEHGSCITIRQSPYRLRVLHTRERNYYQMLRNKLRWGEPAGEST